MQFDKGLGDELLDLFPVGLFGVAFQVASKFSNAVADCGSLIAQLRVIQEFFDVAKPIGEFTETGAGERIVGGSGSG